MSKATKSVPSDDQLKETYGKLSPEQAAECRKAVGASDASLAKVLSLSEARKTAWIEKASTLAATINPPAKPAPPAPKPA